MKSTQIFIYKNQLNNKKFQYLLRDILGVKDKKYILPHMLDENRAIFIHESSSIKIVSYNDDVSVDDIVDKLVSHMENRLNAQKFCVVNNGDGHTSEWYKPKKYKMKLINRFKLMFSVWNEA